MNAADQAVAKDSDALGLMSEESIDRALKMARARIARGERERAELDRAIAVIQEEERLLARLLALRRGGQVDVSAMETARNDRPPAPGSTRQVNRPALQAVVEELTAAGRPVHISELMRLLRDQGVPIPGSGTQANLITHLRRDERLVRPSRGMYGLAAWGLQAMPVGQRTGRRRKRIRSTVREGRNQA